MRAGSADAGRASRRTAVPSATRWPPPPLSPRVQTMPPLRPRADLLLSDTPGLRGRCRGRGRGCESVDEGGREDEEYDEDEDVVADEGQDGDEHEYVDNYGDYGDNGDDDDDEHSFVHGHRSASQYGSATVASGRTDCNILDPHLKARMRWPLFRSMACDRICTHLGVLPRFCASRGLHASISANSTSAR